MVAMVTEGTAKRALAYRYKEDEITFELTLQSASRANETNAIVVCHDGDDRVVVAGLLAAEDPLRSLIHTVSVIGLSNFLLVARGSIER